MDGNDEKRNNHGMGRGMNIFNTIAKSGNYCLPYLITLKHDDFGIIRLVNNNVAVEFESEIYEASAFEYTEPKTVGGVYENAALEITLLDNTVIDFLETTDHLMRVEVVGVLAQNGTVQKIRQFKHRYGTASWNGAMKLSFSFSDDDRLNMQFPPFIFDSDNNRGGS